MREKRNAYAYTISVRKLEDDTREDNIKTDIWILRSDTDTERLQNYPE
jgi:hypothetical protein